MTLQSNRLYLDSTKFDRVMARISRQNKVGELYAYGFGNVTATGYPPFNQLPAYGPTGAVAINAGLIEIPLDGSGYLVDTNGNGRPDISSKFEQDNVGAVPTGPLRILSGDGIESAGFTPTLTVGSGVYDYLPVLSYRRLSQVEQAGAFTNVAGFSYELKVPISHFISQWPNYLVSGESYASFGGPTAKSVTNLAATISIITGGVDRIFSDPLAGDYTDTIYINPPILQSLGGSYGIYNWVESGSAPRILVRLDEFSSIGAWPDSYKYVNSATGEVRIAKDFPFPTTDWVAAGTTNLLSYQIGPDGVVTMVIEDWLPNSPIPGGIPITNPIPYHYWVQDITAIAGPIPSIGWNPATDIFTHRVEMGCYSTRNYFRDPYYSLRKVAL